MLSRELKNHLTKKLIPFWKGLRDETYGGFYGWVDSDLKVDEKAVKGCILNSRILWFFSNAARCLPEDKTLREYADWAYRFLRDFCLDRADGGVFWSVGFDGTPEDTTKHTYNQAFAVYALSSYYRAFGVEEALRLAEKLIALIETKCFDAYGYLEAQDRRFHPVDNDKLSENGVMADRTMNTLLHVLEAYTEYLAAVSPASVNVESSVPGESCREVVREKLRWMLVLIADHVYNPEKHRQEVFFDREMNSLIDLHSYGHDIEAAWLLDRCLDVLDDEEMRRRISPILRDLEAEVYRTALSWRNTLSDEKPLSRRNILSDEEPLSCVASQSRKIGVSCCSLANECERGKVDGRRIWWVQAEGVVGFYNAYQKTGQKRFLEGAEGIWHFIRDYLADPREGGEWFWYTDEEGNPAWEKPVVEPWKCPYHNGRMCMEIMRREAGMFHEKYYEELEKQEALIGRKNEVDRTFYNGIYDRYRYPVLTREHVPLFWRYDLNPESNPYFEERLGINAVMNSGAIYWNGKFYLVARVEGNDRKSFFAVAESDSGVDGFRFWDYPVVLPDTCPEETNVYDMRLTLHEDGYIYGVFCSESKDLSVSDLSAAVAAAGIVRTKDLKTWERLPNLKTLRSPQQRNVVLHPEFVDGKYAFYTRPMDDFIETGSGGGIGFGLCDDITHAVIDEERMTSCRRYHTITESKNGAGAVPIKTPKGWIHIAHGVRNTAAGLRYVIYAFATALEDPSRVIAQPSGLLIGPRGGERIGDVSNVVFTNGAVALPDGKVYLYYASSDTRLHVAVTTLERLMDYVFRTPEDPLRSADCVKQRCSLIERNLELMRRV